MVHFIVGETHSGKSTRFLSLFEKQKDVIGLYSKKLYDNDTIIGYNLVLLPEYKEIPFIKLKDSLSGFPESDFYFQGRFAFLKETFIKGEQYILNISKNTSVWIDEIGGLELKGIGYDSLLKTLLAQNTDLILTVRSSLLTPIMERYKIEDYSIYVTN